MAQFAKLFGEKLLTKEGLKPVEEVLANKSAVAIYFSAHWCPPCRGFTPQLAGWYKDHLQAKNLEVVFVSSDRDQTSFDEYYGTMPWTALPFGNENKAKLSKKFKCQGIPYLVVLNGEGECMTTNGRAAVSADPEGKNLPWKPKTLKDILSPDTPIITSNSKIDAPVKFADVNQPGTYIGLYFSAHWCPPCRGFTPKLAEAYKAIEAKGKKLEIIFCSSDRDQKSWDEYYGEHPWAALPFSAGAEIKVGSSSSGDETETKTNGKSNTDDSNGKSSKELDNTPRSNGSSGSSVSKKSSKKRGLCGALLRRCRLSAVVSGKSGSNVSEKNPKQKELSSHFEVSGIPTFVLLDDKLQKVSDSCVGAVRGADSPEAAAEAFPWYPATVNDIDKDPSSIEDAPAVIVLLEKCTEAQKKDAVEKLEKVAERFKQVQKTTESPEDPCFVYFAGTKPESNTLTARVRRSVEAGGPSEEAPHLVVMDVNESVYFKMDVCPKGGNLDAAAVGDWLEQVRTGKVESKPMTG